MYRLFSKSNTEQIVTENLILRDFTKGDTEEYHLVLNHPDVYKWLGRNDGFSVSEVEQWIYGMTFWKNKHGYAPWAVVDRNSRRVIGHCGLKFAETFRGTELMYAIHPDYNGLGYITEASTYALDFGFNKLGLKLIIAYTLPHNRASRRVMEKLGMEYKEEVIHANMSHVLYEKEA